MFGERKMLLRVIILGWLLSLIGCAPHPAGRAIESSIKALTPDESRLLADTRDKALARLREQFGVTDAVDDITLLQRLIDDGTFSQTADMTPLGIVWGNVICRETDVKWVTAEWDGTRMFALNVPQTTVLLFPIAMLEKRRDRNEDVDFRSFLASTKEAIAKMKSRHEYQR